MTAQQMTIELAKDGRDLETAAEIAAEIAAAEAERAAKKSARKPAAKKAKAAKKNNNPVERAALAALKKGGTFKDAAKAAEKAAKPMVRAAAARKGGKVGPTVGILSALKARKAGLTTAEIHGLFPNTKKSDITTRLRRAGLVAKDMADPKASWTITRAGAARLAEIGGAR
jgi:hypothetical protein